MTPCSRETQTTLTEEVEEAADPGDQEAEAAEDSPAGNTNLFHPVFRQINFFPIEIFCQLPVAELFRNLKNPPPSLGFEPQTSSF